MEEEHYAPSADNSATPAAAMRRKMISVKVGENEEGQLHPKRAQGGIQTLCWCWFGKKSIKKILNIGE